MKTDVFNEYYEYKIKTVYQYSILLSKIIGVSKNKLWHKRKNIEDILNEVINTYFNRNKKSFTKSKSLINCFITNKEISKYNIDSELLSSIDYFIKHKRGFEIPAYEKEIILMSAIINIANKIDVSTSPYQVNKNNYNTIVKSLLEKFNKIDFFELIDDGKKATKLLLELIKTNVRKERKIFDLLTSNISFNRYIDISKENRYYLAQYNYSVPGLNKFDSYATKMIYEKNGIDDKFVSVSADLITITLMKQLSIRKPFKVFFLPIKGSYFEDKNNINDIKYIFDNHLIKKNIVVLINYDDFNLDILNELKNNNADFYIYCSKNSKITDGNKLKGCENYLVSKDFYNNNKDIISKWKDEDINIIIENFDGVVTDKAIMED